MGSCAAPSAKGDDKFITTDYLQQCHAGREILSAQGDAIRNITGTFGNGQTEANAAISFNTASGVFVSQSALRNTIGNTTIIPNTPNNPHLVNFDASRVVPTASENRPRSIAFNYIVRAA
ncbi:hypothetical protein [Escherichia coli]|uniref:hypothetical protein n=1 Tax=Escherichia coli TaxID=562 RepID=UPI003C78BB07